MKKTIAWILVLALLAVASVIGTIAYLTDEEAAENVMTIGKVDIDLLEYERVGVDTSDGDAVVQEFRDNKPLLPAVIEKGFDYTPGDTYVDWTQDAVKWQQQNDNDGYTSPIWDPAKINNEVDKMVFVKNTGNYSAYVRIYFAFEAGNFDTFNEFREMIHLNLNETGDWEWEWIPFLATNDEGGKYFIANATYKKELLPDDFTEISLSQIALDPTAINAHVAAFGDTYEVFVNAQGIQSAGFNDPDTALDEGFGNDIPFEDFTLMTGTDLKTALHNLNGDGSKPITSKVATVTFGLNETYPNIVKDNVGTFTSVEQDAMVYTYYVPNATNNKNYDVYVLADDKIYTPKNSNGLFSGMSALTTVDTTNMDVSRTENMYTMFRDCSKLTTVDTSNWNTEKVQNFSGMFVKCSSLSELDVSDWDTSSATNMYSMFYNCTKLDGLEVGNWDVSNVTDMSYMFNKCEAISSLNVENWIVGNIENMYCMFYNCSNLDGLVVGGWDVSKVTNMAYMFDGCSSITSLNVTNWDVGNVTNFCQFLDNCSGLTSLDVSNWDVSNVTNMSFMFAGCMNIESLDVSNWDVSNVTTFSSFLQSSNDQSGGMKIKEIKGIENWKTSSATDMSWMFYGCSNLTALNLNANPETGAWDVSNVTTMYHMFADCMSLTTLNMKGWNTESLTDMNGIFNTCTSLKVIDVSDFDTQNVIDMSQAFETCYALEEIIGLDKWDTSNVLYMAQMFSSPAGYAVSNHLKVLDLSSFDTSNVTNMFEMFQHSPYLETIIFGEGWDTSNVVDMSNMFRKCPSLTALDVSGWNTAKVTNMEHMFNGCSSLTELNVSAWSTANVTSMEFMFNGCVGLTELDLGSWNTKAVKDSEQMFAGCSNLETIYVGANWDMSQVEEVAEVKNSDGTIKQEKLSSGDMFLGCDKLVGGAGTVYSAANANDKTYAIVDGGVDAPGYLTHISAKPADPEQNQ